MASDKQWVVMDDELKTRFEKYKEDAGLDGTSQALRKTIDEGLRSMGYEPTYQDRSQRWLRLVRGVGSVLGLTALILLGVGVFLGPVFGRYGFGLAVASIAFLAGAEVADRHGDAIFEWLVEAAKNEAEEWTASGDGGDR